MNDSNIEALIKRHGQRINAVMDELLPKPGAPFLTEPAWYHLDTGGKRIRPALCLLTCEALGGDSERAIYFAASVELLHNMLLLHDDVADGDEMRRDKPTVWKKYGVGNAINVGDFLLGRALRAVLQSPVEPKIRERLLDLFVETYERTVEGQALDINARCNPNFTVNDYLRMAKLKTGYYLVFGMVGGAIIAGAPEVTLQCLKKLGENMGPAFQIRDDVIDLTAGKGRGGMKGSDVREGKASILYAHAMAKAEPNERAKLLAIMQKPRVETSDADVDWVMKLYELCGALDFAKQKADALIAEARKEMEYMQVEQQAALSGLVNFMVERTK